jgi:hypothetical protein
MKCTKGMKKAIAVLVLAALAALSFDSCQLSTEGQVQDEEQLEAAESARYAEEHVRWLEQ